MTDPYDAEFERLTGVGRWTPEGERIVREALGDRWVESAKADRDRAIEEERAERVTTLPGRGVRFLSLAFLIICGLYLFALNPLLPLMLLMFFYRGEPSRYYWGWWPGRWF